MCISNQGESSKKNETRDRAKSSNFLSSPSHLRRWIYEFIIHDEEKILRFAQQKKGKRRNGNGKQQCHIANEERYRFFTFFSIHYDCCVHTQKGKQHFFLMIRYF